MNRTVKRQIFEEKKRQGKKSEGSERIMWTK